MTVRSLNSKFIHVGIKTTMRILSNTEPLNAHVVVPVVRNALHQPNPLIADLQWSAVKNIMSSVTPAIESVDFSNLVQKGGYASQVLMNSFVQAQQEKHQRADDMLGPLVRETANKIDELVSLSSAEQNSMKEQLEAARSDHQDTEKQIKTIQRTASFLQKNTAEIIQKVIGTELAEVLSNKIDPHTLEKFCNTLRCSTRIATQVVPALRVLNNLSLAYDTAKVLYPEHVNELESYVIAALQEHQQSLKTTILEHGNSFKDRFNELKKSAVPIIEHVNSNATNDAELSINTIKVPSTRV